MTTRRHGDTETRRYGKFSVLSLHRLAVSPFHRVAASSSEGGFTLLEVLVAVALMAIAVTVVLQLFSADLRAIAASEDYVLAAVRANAAMREVLDDSELSETSWSEMTDDGYRIDVNVAETLQERTENLQTRLLEVTLTLTWIKGPRERAITLRTLKTVEKKV